MKICSRLKEDKSTTPTCFKVILGNVYKNGVITPYITQNLQQHRVILVIPHHDGYSQLEQVVVAHPPISWLFSFSLRGKPFHSTVARPRRGIDFTFAVSLVLLISQIFNS
ncbi:MAG: hypothetical protein R3E08_08065 [Thiotrichaceae bacterium]